jgi:hypothetical protein
MKPLRSNLVLAAFLSALAGSEMMGKKSRWA